MWGHATSSDLVHWELLSPILTKPPSYEKGGAWSGSMYKRGSDVVALYTCTDGKFRNAQCEAIADDASLSSFTRSPDNPIIRTPPEGVAPYYFRDPTEPFHWKGRDYTFIGATDPQGPRGAVLSYDLDGYVFRGHFYDAPPLQHCLGWRDGPRCASIMLECAARRLSLPSRRGDGVRPRRRRVDRRVEVHAIAATASLRVRLRRPRRLRRERRDDPQAVAGRGAPQGRCSDWSRPAFNSAPSDRRRKPGPYIYSERTPDAAPLRRSRVATGCRGLGLRLRLRVEVVYGSARPENLMELAARLRRACHAANFSVQRHADAA